MNPAPNKVETFDHLLQTSAPPVRGLGTVDHSYRFVLEQRHTPFTNATICRLVGGLTSEAERTEVLLYEVEQLILLGCEAGY